MPEPLLITPPLPVISLLEAKAQCRVEHNDDDIYIEGLVLAATGYLDGYYGVLGRSIGVQTWQMSYDASLSAVSELCLPFKDITSLAVVDVGGTPLLATDYSLFEKGGAQFVRFIAPQTGLIKVDMVCGFAVVPENLKHAIKILVSNWYNYREVVEFVAGSAAKEMPNSVRSLIAPFKLNWVT